MRRSRGTGVQTPPPPPENHKTTKPTFNVGAHWSASEAPFKWRFAFCGIWYLSTHQLKKNAVRVGASVSRSVREVKGPMCRIFLLSTVCFYTIVHKDVHLLETSFQTSSVKVKARGQSYHYIRAATCDFFQQCGILTSADSDESAQLQLRYLNHSIVKRLTKTLIRLRVCAGWSEPLLVARKSHVAAQLSPILEIIHTCQHTLLQSICGTPVCRYKSTQQRR